MLLWPKTDMQKWRANNPKHVMIASAKQRAKQNNIPFDISVEDIVFPDVCPYLKTPFVLNTMYAPSLDRVYADRGYVKGNVEVISRKANLMKSNASVEELLEFAYAILERH